MDRPQSTKQWFEHLRAQLRGEAEPVVDSETGEIRDEDMRRPTRVDWR